MTYEEFTVKSGGVALFCRRFGTGSPLLMIHGAGVDSDFFRESAEYLSRQYRVFTYDRRGYGRSGDAGDVHTAALLAADAAAVCEATGQPCHIVAHSAGCAVALELTVARPELVRSLILHEPPMLHGFVDEAAYREQIRELSRLVEGGRMARASCLFYALLGDPDSRAREQTDEELSHLERNMGTFLQKELSLLDYTPNYDALKQIPALVGLGELSRGQRHSTAASQLAERLTCPLVSFPGAHNCAYDLPLAFAAMVSGLLTLQCESCSENEIM